MKWSMVYIDSTILASCGYKSETSNNPYYAAVRKIGNTKETKRAVELLCDPVFNPRQKITIGITKRGFYMGVNSIHNNSNMYSVILVFTDAAVLSGALVNDVVKEFGCQGLTSLFTTDHARIIQFSVFKGAQKMRIFPAHDTLDLGLRDPLEVELYEPEVCISFIDAKETTHSYVGEEIDLEGFRDFIKRARRNDKTHQLSIVYHGMKRNVDIQMGGEALLMRGDWQWKFTWPFIKQLEESTTMVDDYVKSGILNKGTAFLHFVGKTMLLGFYCKSDFINTSY